MTTGYREKTITIDLSDLGNGCFVTIKNPQLLPPEVLTPSATVEFDPATGEPVDASKAQQATNEVLGRIITDWKLYDYDTDAPLPLPANGDTSVLKRVPGYVLALIGKEIEARVNPQ